MFHGSQSQWLYRLLIDMPFTGGILALEGYVWQ